MSELFNLFTQVMLNILLLLYDVLAHDFALSIALFTVLVRVATLPLMLPQQRSAKAMQELQPKIQEIQKKYAKDKEKLSQAQMELYREAGVNPFGGCLPMFIQFPIWIGLYQSIIVALANSPQGILHLADNIYPSFLQSLSRLIPLNSSFLWLDLGRPDPLYILPILVTATMWIQQKMMTTPSTDPQTASLNQTMQITMPLMFGFITLQVSSGLALYWAVSNVVGIVIQYFTMGWGGLFPQKQAKKPRAAAIREESQTAAAAPARAEPERGRKGGSKRKSREKRRSQR
jgi:YidC/Oxa1 family membrane protein insertase